MLALPEMDFRRTPATLIIAAVAVALEIVFTLDPERRLSAYNDYLGVLPSIWEGQLWRPFTTTLIHGNLLHAAFNVLVFLSFAPALEVRFGSFRFLGLVVLLGYLSILPQFLVSTYNGPLVMIVGLSGTIYGLFGILLVGRRWHRDLAEVCDQGTVQFLLFWLVLAMLLTYFRLLPVANTAHVAGLLFGGLFGLALYDTRHRIAWRVLTVIATLAVLATLVVAPGHVWYERIQRERQIDQRFEQSSLESPPDRP